MVCTNMGSAQDIKCMVAEEGKDLYDQSWKHRAGALNGFDTSCTWYTTNYPTVDFGTVGSAASVEDCFRTATSTIVVGAQFHGIVEAGRSVGATFLNDPSFITDELAVLPYACTFDTGELKILNVKPILSHNSERGRHAIVLMFAL